MPSDRLLARLHQLVPGGDATPAPAPATASHPATPDARGTVDVRNAGSARAIDPHTGTAQGKLMAFLGGLLGLTLVTVGLARAWVVRRSR
jgi:energy-converting hydrogenase Eha subunit F